jgi:hypothetical protein
MRIVALAAAAAVTLSGVACGGRSESPAERLWRPNATILLRQLQSDIDTLSSLAQTRTAAARALSDTSELFVLIVAYSDLGGCRSMAAATAAPLRVVASLSRPCGHLERASRLFTRAASQIDARALVQARSEARRAQPQIVEAMLALRRSG